MKLDVLRALLLFGGKSGGGDAEQAGVYGVRFAGTDPAGVRTGAAAGLTLVPATDTAAGQNDFALAYPWSAMRRCCCTLQEDGTVAVNAYQGQPTYAEDGSNGEVLVEVPLFYVAGAPDTDPRISAVPLAGFRAPRKFQNEDGTLKARCYLSAFPGSLGEDGRLHSVAGAVPASGKIAAAFLAAARGWGSSYSVGTSADFELLAYLMVVACGTRDLQSVFRGVTELYAADLPVTAARTDEAAVTMAKGAVEVGDVISIGSGGVNEGVAARRIVTAVEDEPDGESVTVRFTGDPVTTTTADKVSRLMQCTGSANGVQGACGSPVSNTDGRHSFTFFGVENPLYGNVWRFECDWRLASGAVWCCDDPEKYAWSGTDGYTKAAVTLPASGYLTALQADADRPWLALPKTVGGSAVSGLGDYFRRGGSGIRTVLRGGAADSGAEAGPFALNAANNAAWSGRNAGADLSVPG